MAGLTTRPDYDGAADGWANGATLVYGPLAEELLDLVDPAVWAGRLVLDLGAGTGVASDRLLARGARPVAVDLSLGMLRHEQPSRPPSIVADVRLLPLGDERVGGVAAPFVLNHVDDPVAALSEIRRVTTAGSPVVASVFAATSHHPRRDLVDEVAASWGWRAPAWYLDTKANAVPLLASADAMATAATASGLAQVSAHEDHVDVGVTRAAQLVAYRLGQAHVADFLSELTDAERQRLLAEAIARVGDPMEPYRPTVVFLSAISPGGHADRV